MKGTVYAAVEGGVAAITSKGELLWELSNVHATTLAMGANGTLYTVGGYGYDVGDGYAEVTAIGP
jgi:hypothetical protein